MSLHSASHIFSTLSPESSSATTTPLSPINKTLHIDSLPCNTEAVKKELEGLLAEEHGFCKVKVNLTRDRTTSFAIVCFSNPYNATKGMEYLKNYCLTGSKKGLSVDYATIRKSTPREGTDLHFTNRAEIQPQRPLVQHSYGASNTPSERKWGYSPTASIASVYAPISTPHTHLSKYAVEEVSTSTRSLGDKPFGFSYGPKPSSKGLMGSIYAPVNASDSRSVSSQEEELIDTPLMLVPVPAKNEEIDLDKLKDIVREHEIEKEGSSSGAKNGKSFDLLGLNIVPKPQKEQENVYEECPLQEQLKEMSHLSRMMLAKGVPRFMAAKKEEVVEKVSHLTDGGGNAVVTEAEMVSTPQKVTTDELSGFKSSSEVVATKPEMAVNPKLALDDWDDEF